MTPGGISELLEFTLVRRDKNFILDRLFPLQDNTCNLITETAVNSSLFF